MSQRSLEVTRRPYYRWRKHQATRTELVKAYRTNPLLNAHYEAPAFCYLLLVREAAETGAVVCE